MINSPSDGRVSTILNKIIVQRIKKLVKCKTYLGGRLGRSGFKSLGHVSPVQCFVKMPKLAQVPGEVS